MTDSDRPTLELLLAADHINFSVDSKLYIAGEFSEVRAHQVPTVLPSLAVVFRVRAPKAWALSAHTLRLQMVAVPSGTVIFERETSVAAEQPDALPTDMGGWQAEAVEFTQVSGITGLVLPEFGRYALEVLVDGAKIGSRRFGVGRWPDTGATTGQPAPDGGE